MANEIKDLYSAPAALTITLASLATSSVGAGNQSDMIDNSVTRYQRIKIYAQIKCGTSPTASTSIYFNALRGDKHGTPYRTDGAAASAGALTAVNAPPLGVIRVKTSPSTGDVLYGEFELVRPGPEWGVHVTQDTGAALDATAGNHFIHWLGCDPEVQ